MTLRCPCGGSEWDSCCRPLLDGVLAAPTAEALMRSRYVAFTRGDVGYLQATQAEHSTPERWEETKAWALAVGWVSLEIVKTEGGAASDVSGQVAFCAQYIDGKKLCALHEDSHFVRLHSGWQYVRGDSRLESTSIERNAPCPCGSGRKFKQCHA